MKEKYVLLWSLLVLLFVGTFSVSLSYFGTKINSENVTTTSFKTGKVNIKIIDNKLEDVVLKPIYDKDYFRTAYRKDFTIVSDEDSLNSCASIYLDISDISESLKSEYLKYKLISDEKMYEGNFKYASSTDNLVLAENVFIEKNTSIKYNLYIWISYDEELDQMDMLNTNLVARVGVKSYDSKEEYFCVKNN